MPSATTIGSGRDYAMAATATGDIWAWGRNDGGQLGDGTTATRVQPLLVGTLVDVAELVGGRDYVAARVGGAMPPPPPPPRPPPPTDE